MLVLKAPHLRNASAQANWDGGFLSVSSSHPMSRQEEHGLLHWRAGERLGIRQPRCSAGQGQGAHSRQRSCLLLHLCPGTGSLMSSPFSGFLAAPKAKKQEVDWLISSSYRTGPSTFHAGQGRGMICWKTTTVSKLRGPCCY